MSFPRRLNSFSFMNTVMTRQAMWPGAVLPWLLILVLVSPCWAQYGNTEEGTRARVQYTILEETQAPAPVGDIPADARLDSKYTVQRLNQLRYSFLRQAGTHADYFSIDEISGMLSTKAPVDREGLCPGAPAKCDVTFDVAVRPVPVSFLEVIIVVVHVLDLNDHAPEFGQSQVSIPISESVMPGATYMLPTAVDPDSGVFAVRSYSLVPRTPDFGLVITNTSGTPEDVRLALRHKLDREIQTDYTVRLVAYDGGTPPKSGSIVVHVSVQDANDNSPRFDNNTYRIRVREDAPLGTPIVALHASDPDQGPSGQVVYSLSTDGSPSILSPFEINPETGQIVVIKRLDYETHPVYNLLVTAKDEGPDSVPTHARVTIDVIDVNDHAPTLNVNSLTSDGKPEVAEHVAEGQFVAHITVVDEDGGESGNASCILDSDFFYMEPIYKNEYKLMTSRPIDREIDPVVTLNIHCSDKGTPPLTSTQKVNITILDINDNSPVFSQNAYSVTMKENNTIGSHILTVNATDADAGPNARVTYRLSGSEARGLVTIDPGTGVIRTDGVFDFETQKILQFSVTAVDGGSPPRSASASVVVNILDVNDEAPVFTAKHYDFATFENQAPNTEIGSVSATDGDAPPYNTFHYRLQGSGATKDLFTVDKDTGKITTANVLDREYLSNYSFLVLAINPGFPSLTSTATVTVQVADVNDNAPMFIFPTNNNFTIIAPLSAPIGHVICRVKAEDADFGINAKIKYSVAKGNTQGDLQIDETTGAISLHVDKLNNAGYKLKIMAKDTGKPAKTAVTDLNVIVNASLIIPLLGSRKSDENPLGTTHNQLIVITLVAATLVLVTILLAAIICIKKKQRREKRDTYKYVCQVGAAGHNSPTHRPRDAASLEQSGSSPDTRYVVHMENGGHNLPQLERSPKKATPGSRRYPEAPAPPLCAAGVGVGVERPLPASVVPSSAQAKPPNPTPDEGPSDPQQGLRTAEEHTRNCHNNSNNMVQNGSEGALIRAGDRPLQALLATPHPRQARELKPWLLTERELEMHRRLHLFIREPVGHNDSDSTSGCSADMSNADSGRGPSEDGEYSRNGESQKERNQKCLSQVSKDSGQSSTSQEVTDPPAAGPAAIVGVTLGLAAPTGTTHTSTSTLPNPHHHHHHHHHHGRVNNDGAASGADKFPCKCFTMNRSGLQWVKRGQGFGTHSRGRPMPGNLQEACDCLSSASAAAVSNPAFQSDKSLANPPPGGDPHAHPDYLTQRKLLENDRRYRRSRSQRIAPEHADGTYVNTFGHTIPLKTLGRLEENGDEYSDDCSTTTSGSYDVGQFIVSSPLPQSTAVKLDTGGHSLKGDSTI